MTSNKFDWPKNDGFIGRLTDKTLEMGHRIDRYGVPYGKFVSPEGVSYSSRAVPYSQKSKDYYIYEVIKPFKVQAGEAAPWFGEKGGAIQYVLPKSAKELVEEGYLRQIKFIPRKD